MTQLFNIAALAVASTAAIHLKSTTGELLYADEAREQPLRVIVYSPGSKAFAAVDSRQSARAVKRMNDNEGKLSALTSEERRLETAQDLAAVTVQFENFTYGDGSLAGEELFTAAYGDPGLGFITRQVSKAINDWATFKSASVAS